MRVERLGSLQCLACGTLKLVVLTLTLVVVHVDAWIFNEDNGDVVLQGPMSIEPSYGQDPSVQFKRNDTLWWKWGSANTASALAERDAFYLQNTEHGGIPQKVFSLSQEGSVLLAAAHNESSAITRHIGDG